MPATKGTKIPGGLPRRVDEYSVDKPYKAGHKPLRFGDQVIQPGEVIPAECIEAIPRLESWVRGRRIVPLNA